MRTSDKDLHLLKHIAVYCERIKSAVNQIETLDNLLDSPFYQDALSMPMLQIGELVRNMTDETKEKYNYIPWKEIRALRNTLVHSYGEIDWDRIWDTAINDIPVLKKECQKIEKQIEKQARDKDFSNNFSR